MDAFVRLLQLEVLELFRVNALRVIDGTVVFGHSYQDSPLFYKVAAGPISYIAKALDDYLLALKAGLEGELVSHPLVTHQFLGGQEHP